MNKKPAAPQPAPARLRQAIAHHQQGQLAAAEALYQEILRTDPKNFDALHLPGVIAVQTGHPENGVELIGRALALNRHHAEAQAHIGNAYRDLRRPEEALASYDRSLRLKPHSAVVVNNRGTALEDLMRPEEALACYNKALSLDPGYAEALNNRGNALQDLKRPAEALDSYARVLQLRPGFAEAHWNESLCRLVTGDLSLGFEKFEWRWKTAMFKPRDFRQPLWLGKTPLRGKSILLHAEQGLGDAIQFCRYAKQVAAQGGTVLLEAQAALRPLLAALEGVSQVFARGEPLPDFDCHCPLLSLPLACGTTLATIPAEGAYLRSDPARQRAWATRLGEQAAPRTRIGLAWSGSAGHKKDHNRSIPLAEFITLAQGPAQFVSLQKEVRPSDLQALRECQSVAHYGDELADFADTAALIANLDLVIAVDTSVAHLAGALGKPVWLLLPFNPDWRWLLDRSDSPWYPTFRLFRQPTIGDWPSVLRTVAAEVLALPGQAGNVRTPA